ncbi:MAG: CPBP family intramembrane metalloprotease [Pseudomonadota bacterium]|nr:CPBP family intramembrane metalloprotease [Pseudomonadota bacterium]
MTNRLAAHLTHWKVWYAVLAVLAMIAGSQVTVLAQLGPEGEASERLLTLLSPLPLIAGSLLGLALYALAARRWPTVRDLGLAATLTRRDLGLIAAVFIVTHAFFWLLSLGHDDPNQAARLFEEMNLGQGLAADIAIVISAVIAAPVCEELLYRGLLLRAVHDGLARRMALGWATAIALLASAAAFALPHLGDALLGRMGLAYLVTGLALGLVYVWTGSLTAVMVSHALQSCYAFGSILLFGRGDTAVSPLIYLIVFGCPLWVYLCARGLRAVLPKGEAPG